MVAAVPATPFRGIRSFRYADHAIFFARAAETRVLARLVDVYRGVFLYGDSGNGKSSLVDAGLLPQARALGFEPVRVRVQPRAGEELVIEPIAVSDDESAVLPCALAPEADGSARVVLSIAEFEARVRAASSEEQPLIVFDQFEEILTLFEDDGESRRAIAEMIVRLLREALPIKLLFAFREDYLGGVKQLLGARPELVDQALRLGPPPADSLSTIIRGPFERHPGHFAGELDPALAVQLQAALAERFGTGEVSLSEVQTVCLRLWRSADPAALLADRGVQGLLEDDLGEALDALTPDLRAAAIAVLSQMVTSGGTRNVVSAEDLRQRVRDAYEGIAPELVDEALDRLERESKLVRRERRRDIYLYEITSEFLVPWISRRRDELRLAQERRRGRRRLRIVVAIAGALVLAAAGVAAVVLGQRAETQRQVTSATSLALAASSGEPLASRPDVSLALAFEAYRTQPRLEASTAVYRALTAARGSRLRGVLDTGPSAIAFSPDGKLLATGGAGTAVGLWDPVLRRKVGSLRGDGEEATLVAFSPDGRTVAAAATDGGLLRWDLVSRRRLAGSSAQEGGINAIAFSPDSKTIATAGNQDGTVRLWDAVSGRQVGRLAVRGDRVTAVAFSPDGKSVVTAGDEDEVRLWDATSRERVGRLGARSRGALAVAFSPDGKTLATASQYDTAVRLWDAGSRAQVGLLKGRGLFVAVAFSPDGSTIATVGGGEDRTVLLWGAASHKQQARLSGHDGDVIAIAFHPDGRTLASAATDDTVRLWDLSRRARPGPLGGRTTPVHAVAFTPDGSTLIAAGEDGTFALLDPVDHTQVARIGDPESAVLEAAFSADRKIAATADTVGRVIVWDLAGRRELGQLSSGNQFVTVALSPDGGILATGGVTFASSDENAIVALWDPRSRKQVGRLRGRGGLVRAAAFSPDGKLLVTVTADDGVHLWDPVRRREVGRLRGPGGAVGVIAFSPDGKTLATGDEGGTVRLWDVAARKQVGLLAGHTESVAVIAFSPDGKTVATSSGSEYAVRLWDLATRRQKGSLLGHTSPVYGLAFSPDSRTLASASADETVRLWTDISWRDETELHEVVCDVLLPGLARSEWDRYAPGIAYRRSCP